MLVFMIIALGVSILEYRKLIKKKRFREVAVSSMLLVIGLALAFITLLRMTVPSPLEIIIVMFKPISQYMHAILS